MPYTIKPGSFKYKKSNGQFSEIDCFEGPDSPVTDVQINGTTILDAQGVANIPVADANNLGIVKTNASGGIDINSTTNKLRISNADNSQIRTGTDAYKPITPSIQHSSVFYGLAKLAGADMAQSSNPVGQFTPEALVAIQKMLGVYQAPWELIREDTFTNETEADHVITTDANGESLELTEAVIMVEFPQQETAASFGGSGAISFYYNKSATNIRWTVECGQVTMAANDPPRGCSAALIRNGNLLSLERAASAQRSNSGSVAKRYRDGFGIDNLLDAIHYVLDSNGTKNIWKISINRVTGTSHYILYGRRKWTT